MSEENNDCSKCLANGVYCQKCYSRPDVPYFSKEKKRTISLEAYLKMQNEILAQIIVRNMSCENWCIDRSRDAVDALLRHNDVVVEE